MNDSQRLSATFSIVLVLATMSIGWVAWNRSRALPRAMESRSAALLPPSEQDVVARLWEDPLQAVQAEINRHDEEHPASTHSARSLASTIQLLTSNKPPVLILAVLIPGSPFPDDTETRLRTRYAVQMAMAEQRYEPGDRDHLGFFHLPWPGLRGPHHGSDSGRFCTKGVERHIPVPFEWFQPQAGRTNSPALVLWLPEDSLRFHPFCMLAFLRHELTGAWPSNDVAGFFVVGPRSSDTLKIIASQEQFTRLNATQHHICQTLLRRKLRIFSSQATAPDALIGITPSNNWRSARRSLNDQIARLLEDSADSVGSWTYLTNMVSLDDQLTDLLVSELGYRRIKTGPKTEDRILLLAEADTSYGRSLALAFQASLASAIADGLGRIPRESPTATSLGSAQGAHGLGNLTVARYLRGLDKSKGTQLPDSSRASALPRSPEEAVASLLRRQSAPAAGESQLDYAERLAARMKAAPHAERVRAVGILGADVADKLILMRALRPHFPEAVFFTTDLDARLWHEDHLPYTRNLIVASGWGIDAQTSFTMPAFRDGYQLGVFNACRAALSDCSRSHDDDDGSLEESSPRLFEIGRHGPVELVYRQDILTSFLLLLRESWNLVSGLFRPRTIIGAALLAIGVAMAITIWQYCTAPLKGWRWVNLWREHSGKLAWFALGTAIALAALYVCARLVSQIPGGEPWAWSAGVSSWPTQLARVFVFGCILWTFHFMWSEYRHYRRRWATEFFGKKQPDVLPNEPSWLRRRWDEFVVMATAPFNLLKFTELKELLSRWRTAWDRVRRPWLQGDAEPDRVDALELFKVFVAKGCLRARCLRVGLATVMYLALGFGLMLLSGMPETANIRGSTAYTIDRILLWITIVAFCALVFFVIDSIWLSAQFLKCIGKPISVWPPEGLAPFKKRFGLGNNDLEGLLDVKFAAEMTRNAGRLILLPFSIQLMIIVGRNSLFDNWSWPGGLLVILGCNIVLACVGWALLRRAAKNVRRHARDSIDGRILQTQIRLTAAEQPLKARIEQRKLRLEEVRRAMDAENRGAYSPLIQDPALIAVLVPTGALGVLAMIAQALFGSI